MPTAEQELFMRKLTFKLRSLVAVVVGLSSFTSWTQLASAGDKEVVAIVNGETITTDQLGVQGQLLQLAQQAYQVRIQALRAAIERNVLEEEAQKWDLAVEELLEQKLLENTSEVTLEDLESFYALNRRVFRKPLVEIRGDVEELFKLRKRASARQQYVEELLSKADVRILIEPPRFTMNLENVRRRGPADAPVTIVEYSDFQCSYCKKMQPVMHELMAKYKGVLSWIFKDLPLKRIHPGAAYAAEAARCAGEQGKFWEYRDALFDAPRVKDDLHPKIVGSLKLNSQSFEECISSGRHRLSVEADISEARMLGIRGTPAFIINGILLSGAQPIEKFMRTIDAELALVGKR